MGTWEPLVGMIVAAFVGGYVKHAFFTAPQKSDEKVTGLEVRLTAAEKQLAIMQETKVTEQQVRTVVHEQLQPLMLSISLIQQEQMAMKIDMERQSGMLRNIDEKIEWIADELKKAR